MPEKLTQPKRQRLLTRSLDDVVSQFGFHHHAGPYFSRTRNALVDAFFFQFTRSNFRFSITYGVGSPALLKQLQNNTTLNLDSKYPDLTISPHVIDGNEFGCKYEEHILNSTNKIDDFFSTIVLPWLDRYQTTDDVIAEYHQRHIRTERPVGTEATRLVLRWTVYGLMLYNHGQRHDSVSWLEAALQQWSSNSKPTDNEKEWVRILNSIGIGT